VLGTEEVVHFWLVDPADGVKASIVELDDFVGVSLEVQLQAALLEVRTRRAKGLPCARRSASAPPGVAFSSDDDRRLADVEGGSVDHLDRDRSGIAHEGLDAGVADGGGGRPVPAERPGGLADLDGANPRLQLGGESTVEPVHVAGRQLVVVSQKLAGARWPIWS
jgi:hypothetical protein